MSKGRKSFLDRVQPNRERCKLIDWPLPCEGTPPRVRVKVLGQDQMEAAYFATVQHFKDHKPKIANDDPAFTVREHVELVWRAFEDDEGHSLTETADDLATEPAEYIAPLYAEWSRYQSDLTTRPLDQAQMDLLVDALKKNTQEVPLHALPSSWLIALITTLASQPADSTPNNRLG